MNYRSSALENSDEFDEIGALETACVRRWPRLGPASWTGGSAWSARTGTSWSCGSATCPPAGTPATASRGRWRSRCGWPRSTLLRDGGEDPVLMLDDVFAELDTGRRERLAGLVAGAEQVLVTAAVPADIPAVLAGARFTSARAGRPVTDEPADPDRARLSGRGLARAARRTASARRPAEPARRRAAGRILQMIPTVPRPTPPPPGRRRPAPGGRAWAGRGRPAPGDDPQPLASAIEGLLDTKAGSSGRRWARCSAGGPRSSARSWPRTPGRTASPTAS